jgi:5-methylcytosine-specific restriction endonuclease McrA
MIKRKKKSIEKVEEEIREAGRMKIFHDLLWSKLPRKKVCSSCGVEIHGQNKSYYWDHLIEKSVHPELKYAEWNMYFCCGECHGSKTNGFPTDKHKQAIEEAKKKYEETILLQKEDLRTQEG